MANNNDKYLSGLFVRDQEGKFGPEISIGITDEGIEAIKNLPKNGDFRNFYLSRQRNDPTKYSVRPQAPKKSGDDGNGDLPF
jgi:hypothetical protein